LRTRKTVLVAGATGNQGGAVGRSLLKRGHSVRALTRNPSKAESIKKLGAHIVQGDLLDEKGLAKALTDVDAFFVVTTPFDKGFGVLDTQEEVRQGKTAIAAAKEARTPHIILTSVASADKRTGIPHFETKAEVERFLHQLNVPATVVRPTSFMDNYTSPWMLQSLKAGTLTAPTKPQSTMQMVATRDIGEFVSLAIETPEKSIGQTVELVGDSKTMQEIARSLSGSLGQQVNYIEMPDDLARKLFGEDGMKMTRWFDREGYGVDIQALEARWGIRMTRFDQFLRETDWTKIQTPQAGSVASLA
jgi:uncharacterized protein YbjT (DUF2867 family)